MSESHANLGIYRLLTAARLRRTVLLGMKSLWSHRLRSLLTVLGIVFGVCSVIAMLAIGEGASYEAQEQIRRLGSNNIIIKSVKPPEDLSATTERSWTVDYGITYEDVRRIENTIPSVDVIIPNRIIRQNVSRYGRRVDCDIIGTLPSYMTLGNLTVRRGRFFNDLEYDDKKNVSVIDSNMATQLFPVDDPLGQSVKVDEDYYRVIGVIDADSGVAVTAAAMEAGGGNRNGNGGPQLGNSAAGAPYRMYIPLAAAKSRFGEILVNRSSGSFSAERVELHEATVKVLDVDDVIETNDIIADLLAKHHKKKDYDIIVPLQLLQTAERTKRIFNIVLGAIAAISLIVGGIGIMNIMLASVTERTREIGIRRALGARRRDIVIQFLIETVLLSGTGGVIGVGIGLAIPFVITRFAEMKTIVTLWSPLIAFTISALVGVVFGIYPAMRAAKMDPVEALRHE